MEHCELPSERWKATLRLTEQIICITPPWRVLSPKKILQTPEYNLPGKLKELYEEKDYGQYADESGEMRVCFIASNHTSGGNSGSPVFNDKGELIGLNFDRTWESTMSDIMFNPTICRNITVDIRYVLFIMDKFAGAGHLVEEMDLVKG